MDGPPPSFGPLILLPVILGAVPAPLRYIPHRVAPATDPPEMMMLPRIVGEAPSHATAAEFVPSPPWIVKPSRTVAVVIAPTALTAQLYPLTPSVFVLK